MFIKNLTKQYDGKPVVDSVSFEIPKGKVISLIGPTEPDSRRLMGIISRLIARDSGLVEFDGNDIAKWKSRELSKRLAILTQSNNIQMKLTVREAGSLRPFPVLRRAHHGGRQKDYRSGDLPIWNWKSFRIAYRRAVRRTAAARLHCNGNRTGYRICIAG